MSNLKLSVLSLQLFLLQELSEVDVLNDGMLGGSCFVEVYLVASNVPGK